MHHPTKTLPQHPIPAPQPLHLNLPRQLHDFNAEREFNFAAILIHVGGTVSDAPSVCAAPDVLTRFADAAGALLVPGPYEIEGGELRVDGGDGG